MKKMYYLEVYFVTRDSWVVRMSHDNLNSLYETMYDWVNEGHRKINKNHIRITEGWVLV